MTDIYRRIIRQRLGVVEEDAARIEEDMLGTKLNFVLCTSKKFNAQMDASHARLFPPAAKGAHTDPR